MVAFGDDRGADLATRIASLSEVQAVDFGRRLDAIHAVAEAIAPIAYRLKDQAERIKEHTSVAKGKGVWAAFFIGALVAWGGREFDLSFVTTIGWVILAICGWMIVYAAIEEYAATRRKRELEVEFSHLRFHWLAAGASDFTL